MQVQNGFMKWRVVLVVVALMVGCTSKNPRDCSDGTCTDPAFPFCDIEGNFGDTTKTCVAVDCTPGMFASCRGDTAITCNSAGTDFDLIQCERGCDEASGGCRLCDPNETACTNGTVATCDASGAVTSSHVCPLGCFENEPRCRDIDPSNGLAQYLDASATALDLDLSAGGSIDTQTGNVHDVNGTVVPVTTVQLPAPVGGPAIRVLIVRSARIGNVQVSGQPALAIVSNADVTIEGALSLWRDEDQATAVFPGEFSTAGCGGGAGTVISNAGGKITIASAGGGAYATAGGKGGSIQPSSQFGVGGAAGQPSGSPSLEPLRGGCGSTTSSGGGAIQISSRTKIELKQSAIVNANGQIGILSFAGPEPSSGGGAGGGILLEAPVITLGMGTRLLVNGGPAATGALIDPPTSTTTAPSPGAACTSTGSTRCAAGGAGAASGGPATDGVDVPFDGSAPNNTTFIAAGGGGGLGYIRINTQTGQFDESSDAITSGMLAMAPIRTR
jgi:hypothetical protein